MDRRDRLNLQKRYLVWLYKVTKEAFDKIERKFTQTEIDKLILRELVNYDKNKKLQKFINEFKVYIQNKEKEGLALKYENGQLKSEYYFLALKLKAIERVIVKELNMTTLWKIKKLYQEEMLRRIIEERQENKQ